MLKVFKEDNLGVWLKDNATKDVLMLNKNELKLNDDCLRSLLIKECEFTATEANEIIQEVRN